MKKKKILWLSDDIRQLSGVATQSREIITGICHKYDILNIGGSIKHPEAGKLVDISDSIKRDFGIEDANVRVFPVDGYGTQQLIRQVMEIEKPDMIVHFTDPRFWGWLYMIEREIRRKIPLIYYTIWDDLPYPLWNKPFYESCDGLLCISKQTKNIVENVLGEGNYTSLENISTSLCKRLVSYVPHCANENIYKPIDLNTDSVIDFKEEVIGKKEYDFILFYNNRNIRRKKPADCILVYKKFCDAIGKDKAKKCLFLMHTQSKDGNGTDLKDVKNKLCPDYDIIFTENNKYSPEKLNILYNLVDVTINLADNEGWGLATTESIMAGTPIIATVTGGLQDQMGFVDDKGNSIEFTKEIPSNHTRIYTNHGEWVYPIYPACRTLQGSIPTPYIFADHVNYEDATNGLLYWYNMGREKRKECGLKGREWGLKDNLSRKNTCEKFIESIEAVLKYWKPRERYDLIKVEEEYRLENMGIL